MRYLSLGHWLQFHSPDNICDLNTGNCASVAIVRTDVFRKKEIIVPGKFVTIVGIFDKIDNLENRGVI